MGGILPRLSSTAKQNSDVRIPELLSEYFTIKALSLCLSVFLSPSLSLSHLSPHTVSLPPHGSPPPPPPLLVLRTRLSQPRLLSSPRSLRSRPRRGLCLCLLPVRKSAPMDVCKAMHARRNAKPEPADAFVRRQMRKAESALESCWFD